MPQKRASNVASNAKGNSKKLNAFINSDVNRYVSVKQHEFDLYYSIITKLINKLHTAMAAVDPYYEKYCQGTIWAGSHHDNLKITKPDEFDIVFPIGLPVNVSENQRDPEGSDIVIEPQDAGYVELITGPKFQYLPFEDDYETNKTACDWADNNYLLRSKFKDWFKKVIAKALNSFESYGTLPLFKVKGRSYSIGRSEGGPAITLIVEDVNSDFKMDVDLVPALTFPEDRWPVEYAYMPIPEDCKQKFWLVVPKANREDPDDEEAISRTWRLGMQYQESALMHDLYFLKPTIRLLKKLRDSQGMYKIVSYFIKTIFLWEIVDQDNEFWMQNPTDLFKYMVKRFLDCLEQGEILYFWNAESNCIKDMSETVLNHYCNILRRLDSALKEAEWKTVAEILLTREEYQDFEKRCK